MSDYFFLQFCFLYFAIKMETLPQPWPQMSTYFIYPLFTAYTLIHHTRTKINTVCSNITFSSRLLEKLCLNVAQVWGVVMERRLHSNHRWAPCVVHSSCPIRGTIWLKSKETVQQRKDHIDSLKRRSETTFTFTLLSRNELYVWALLALD